VRHSRGRLVVHAEHGLHVVLFYGHAASQGAGRDKRRADRLAFAGGPAQSVSVQWNSTTMASGDVNVNVQITSYNSGWLGMAIGNVMLGNYVRLGPLHSCNRAVQLVLCRG